MLMMIGGTANAIELMDTDAEPIVNARGEELVPVQSAPVPASAENRRSSDLASIEAKREPWYRGITVGVGAGALSGATGEIGYRIPYSDSFLKNRFAFRAQYNSFQPFNKPLSNFVNEITDKEDIELGIDVKGQQFGLLVDFHPFGYVWGLGALRLTGGYYLGKFDLNVDIDASKKVSGTALADGLGTPNVPTGATLEYTGTGGATAQAQLSYGNIAGPYAGLGLDMGLFWGLRLTLDAGAVFTRAPQIDGKLGHAYGQIDSVCIAGGECLDPANLSVWQFDDILSKMIAEGDAQLAEADKEMQDIKKEFNDSLSKFGYFPIVKLGLTYRF